LVSRKGAKNIMLSRRHFRLSGKARAHTDSVSTS
jgi:hypothetical protein